MESILSVLNCYNTSRKGFIINHNESSHLLYKVIENSNIMIPKYNWKALTLGDKSLLDDINISELTKTNIDDALNIEASFEEAKANEKITVDVINQLRNDHLSRCMRAKLTAKKQQVEMEGGNDSPNELLQMLLENDTNHLVEIQQDGGNIENLGNDFNEYSLDMNFDLDAETEQQRIESEIEGLVRDMNAEFENKEMKQCGGAKKRKWRLKR